MNYNNEEDKDYMSSRKEALRNEGEHITEICGGLYRCRYDPENHRTVYVGPVKGRAEVDRICEPAPELGPRERTPEQEEKDLEEMKVRHGMAPPPWLKDVPKAEEDGGEHEAILREKYAAKTERLLRRVRDPEPVRVRDPEPVRDSEPPVHVHVHIGDVISGDKVDGDKVAGNKVSKRLHDSVNTGGM